MMRFELVSRYHRLEELQQPWQALWTERQASPFQSFDWVFATAKVLPVLVGIHVGVVWEDDTLRAVIPLQIRSAKGLRVLEWLGQDLTDHCDALGDLASLTTCWQQLRARKGYDIVRLKNMLADAAIAPLLPAAGIRATDSESCFVLKSEWADGTDWWNCLPSKNRTKWKARRKKLDAMGTIETVVYREPPSDLLIEQLRQMKEDWAAERKVDAPGIFAPGLKPLIHALAASGTLHMIVLTCNGNVVGGNINILHDNRLWLYFTTFSPAFESVGGGISLAIETIRWAWDNGLTEVDHLRGPEVYKGQFANTERIVYHHTGAGSALGRSALTARAAINRIRRRNNPAAIPRPALSARMMDWLVGS